MRKGLLVVLGGLLLTLMLAAYSGRQQNRPTIAQHAFVERLQNPAALLLLDVRSPEEFAQGHIPGAINVPHTALAERLDEVRVYQDSEVVVYCERGVRAGKAEDILRSAGFHNVLHLEGDMERWRGQALPVVVAPGKS